MQSYGIADRRETFGLISSQDHSQRSSPSRISDTPREGIKPAQNLSLGFAEWSCAVVITTAPVATITVATITTNGQFIALNNNVLMFFAIAISQNRKLCVLKSIVWKSYAQVVDFFFFFSLFFNFFSPKLQLQNKRKQEMT